MSFFDTDEIYNDQFNKTYRVEKMGLTGNVEEDIVRLESTINSLYDFQGLDRVGRGDIFLAKNQANIAATESVLYELKEKMNRD